MLFPNLFFPPIIPNDKFFQPPFLKDLMESIVNFDREEKIPITEISSYARERIFNFSYPLSNKVVKADFETKILDKFIMRRIGQETFTAWQIALKVKLNEIMPYYNKLFDSFEDWNLFNDGETYERTRDISNESTVDSRYSKLPQNEIQDVKNGSYMTDYTLGQNESTGGEVESYSKDNSDKISTYDRYIQNKSKIMSLIYNDLEELFYGIARLN